MNAITASRADLETPDLTVLLRQMSERDIDGLARIIAEMPRLDVLNRCVTHVALETLALRGAALIPAIVKDLSWLASPTIGTSKSYRQVLQAVARRHDIADDGQKPPSEIERALQAHYLGRLRPSRHGFGEKPAKTPLSGLASRIPFASRVASAAFPNSRVVTAALLEIAALRRIALVQEFARGLEAA